MKNQFQFNPQQFQHKEQLKREIRRYGTVVGLCIIAFLVIQEIMFIPLTLLGLEDFYSSDQLFQQCFGLVATVISLCVPFMLAGRYFQKTSAYDVVPAGKADHTLTAVLAVPAGVALCLIGNYVAGIFSMIFEIFGVELSMPDMTPPASGYELFIYLLRLTIVAGVIEEVAFRGTVLQPLRKYGNWFAIAMGATAFALVHCNLIQAPFALVAGLVIGYFTVATGTLWVGVAIHLLNNGISAVISLLAITYGDDFANTIGTYVITAAIIIGLACAIFFVILRGKIAFDPQSEASPTDMYSLTKWEKFKAFFGNIPMLIAFLAVCLYTSFYISI